MRELQLGSLYFRIRPTFVLSRKYVQLSLYSSWYELTLPRKGLRIPDTDPAPFVLYEFCETESILVQTHGNAPQEPEKTSVSKFRGQM